MKEESIKVAKEVVNRLKSPVVWAGIIAIVGLIFTTAGAGFEDVTTWKGLLEVLIGIVTSPAKIAMIIVALFGFLNNPGNKDSF